MVSSSTTIARSFYRARPASRTFPQPNGGTGIEAFELLNLFHAINASDVKNKSGSIDGICDRNSFSFCKFFGFTDAKRIELFVGAFVVIGHSVFHALPNQVII